MKHKWQFKAGGIRDESGAFVLERDIADELNNLAAENAKLRAMTEWKKMVVGDVPCGEGEEIWAGRFNKYGDWIDARRIFESEGAVEFAIRHGWTHWRHSVPAPKVAP